DDGNPKTMAAMHPLKVRWSKPGAASEVYGSMYPITEWAYHQRGGKSETNPGYGKVSGGRSDVHLCVDSEGELYILSKSDGMIRKIVAAE
ncbi:MAG: hypothetical protein KGN84_07890, partial [Acidobacteriota bacterium]|nr:hypothetical protein [Acidobacteriota bacterium]